MLLKIVIKFAVENTEVTYQFYPFTIFVAVFGLCWKVKSMNGGLQVQWHAPHHYGNHAADRSCSSRHPAAIL